MTAKPRIYLDHAATTPMLPAAKAAMIEAMARWANPSSPHAEGRAARAVLEDARERIKRALGWDGELIFTSGATEAIEIAMKRAKGGRRFISAVEHDAVFRAAGNAQVLPIQDGAVAEEALKGALAAASRPVVAIQHVNSETGIVQPLDRLAPLVREAGGILVTDCAQSAGKVRLPDADMLIVSAHKLGGPPGVGALLVSDLGLLSPTGGQETGYRGGTENLPAIVAFAAALESINFVDGTAEWLTRTHGLADCILDLEYPMQLAGGGWIGDGLHELSILAVEMPHLSAKAQLIQFDAMGLAVSAGSACSSGSLKSSRTLKAFGIDEATASRTVRVSFGWSTTAKDIYTFLDAWKSIAEDARKRAA